MDHLFKKALIISDAHFGRSGNSPIANQDNLDFLVWAIDMARTWGAETCIMLGDWFNNRHSIGVGSMHAALQGLELISAAFDQSWFLVGNHDNFYREKRDITSIEFAKHISKINIISDPITIDDVIFVPWLMPDEHKSLNLKGRYVFGHLELAGFFTNSRYEMPESDHTQSEIYFKDVGEVFTGHYHGRQIRKNITYVGNLMPFDFNDDGDSDRGVMLLEYGKEPIFRAWPNQPLYKSMKLSQVLADPDNLLKQNMTAHISVDMVLKYEDSQEIKNTLLTNYGLRKVELLNGIIEGEKKFEENVKFKTVDQIVIEGLESVESVELSSTMLVRIYNSL